VPTPLTEAHPRSATIGRQAIARAPAETDSTRHPFWVHLAVLGGYLAGGIAVTWPHATYLAGRLPATRDAGSYVWGFWWMAQSVLHLRDPWVTHAIAAPVGTDLGMHALMPLVGVVMLPVTLVFGPSASFNLLSVLLPGLMAYAMWRVAKLWLPSMFGSVAAGAFFGFSALIDFQTWVHLNLAAGALFLPMTLEAAVRLRRRPGLGQAAVLGIVVGASLLTDQESAILCLALAAAATVPWLFAARRDGRARKGAGPEVTTIPAHASAADAIAALPTVPRMAADVARSGLPAEPPTDRAESEPAPRRPWPVRALRFCASLPLRGVLAIKSLPGLMKAVPALLRSLPRSLPRLPALVLGGIWSLIRRLSWSRLGVLAAASVVALVVASPQLVAIMHADAAGNPSASLSAGAYLYGIRLPDMFLPSPRITSFGLHFTHAHNDSTFGALPTLLALTGVALGWRKRNVWLLLAFWVTAALLAVGSDIILPSATYTPVAKNLDGVHVSAVLPFTWFAEIPGLSGFREPSRIAELGLLPVALLAGYTVSWLRFHARPLMVIVLLLAVLEAGLTTPPKASKTMPDRLPALDAPIAADHSGSIVVDVPFGLRGGTGVTGLPFSTETEVLATADGHPLADALLSRVPLATKVAFRHEPFYEDLTNAQTGHYSLTPQQFLVAARNAVHMHIGWVLLWVANKHLRNFLTQCGFRYAYRADNVSVWRPSGYANAALP